MSFISLLFSSILPSGFTEPEEVPVVSLHLMREILEFPCLAQRSYIPCGECDILSATDLLCQFTSSILIVSALVGDLSTSLAL